METTNLFDPPPPGRHARLRALVGELARLARGCLGALRDDPVPALAALALVLAGVVSAITEPAAAPIAPAVAPVPTAVLSVPTARADARPEGRRFERAAVAYAAPDGAVLGAIEPGRPYRVVARYGADWLLLDVDGSGAVWARLDDVGLPAGLSLADLAPTPAPVMIVVDRPAPPAPPAPLARAAVAQPEPAPLVPLAPEPTPAGWQGVPYALEYRAPEGAAADCPLVLAPDALAACMAGR